MASEVFSAREGGVNPLNVVSRGTEIMQRAERLSKTNQARFRSGNQTLGATNRNALRINRAANNMLQSLGMSSMQASTARAAYSASQETKRLKGRR